MENYVIGVDYGTDSVRTILVDAANGNEISKSIFYYPRWKQKLYCDASINQFRQHPLDYVDGLQHTIKECLQLAGPEIAANVKGISIDTTGSTLVAIDEFGVPLAMHKQFEDNPNAMFILWKDHTAIQEANAINVHAQKFEINYLQYVGGIYSSEWYWAKILHTLLNDQLVQKHAYSWVEHCDWIPFLLTGGNNALQIKRGVCAAGHKGLWAESFGGFPPNEFFATLNPILDGVVDKLDNKVYAANEPAGIISEEWAIKLGLPNNVVIGIGAFDAHMGAVGGQIEPYYLSKVMGTTTCDMLVAPIAEINNKCIKGICGQVNSSILPNLVGLEAGQSAFGDTYAWYKNILITEISEIISNSKILNTENSNLLIEEINEKILFQLSAKAALLPNNLNAPVATDWINGRRTPDTNQSLKASIQGLNLGSDAVVIFKTLVEATCFGAKAIVERFQNEGITIKGIIGLGGVAKKSAYIMQTMANVLNMPIKIQKSDQTCALGAAMFAATVSGIYNNVDTAMEAMGSGFDVTYYPDATQQSYFLQMYEKYKSLGAFTEKNI
jgi:L-ribulokinase